MLLKIVAAYGVHVRTQDDPAAKDHGRKKNAKRSVCKPDAMAAMPSTASISVLA